MYNILGGFTTIRFMDIFADVVVANMKVKRASGRRYPVSAIMDGKLETLATEGLMDCVRHRRKSLYQGCPKNVHTMLYLPLISIEVHKYDGPQAIYGKWPW
jgi:hypothetical protein